MPVLLRRQLANRLEELRLIERRQHGLHGPGMVERVVDRGAHVGVVDRVEGRAHVIDRLVQQEAAAAVNRSCSGSDRAPKL